MNVLAPFISAKFIFLKTLKFSDVLFTLQNYFSAEGQTSCESFSCEWNFPILKCSTFFIAKANVTFTVSWAPRFSLETFICLNWVKLKVPWSKPSRQSHPWLNAVNSFRLWSRTASRENVKVSLITELVLPIASDTSWQPVVLTLKALSRAALDCLCKFDEIKNLQIILHFH